MAVNNQWLEYHVEDKHATSLNDIIEQEASSLSNLHRRISLCANIKFEKQLVVAFVGTLV
jgi:hypothetical protein